MSKEVKVILELSDDVQTLLEEQGIDLYQELQQELPSIHLQKQSDPEGLVRKERFSDGHSSNGEPCHRTYTCDHPYPQPNHASPSCPNLDRRRNRNAPSRWNDDHSTQTGPLSNESRSVELPTNQQASPNPPYPKRPKRQGAMSQKRYAYLIGANGPQTGGLASAQIR